MSKRPSSIDINDATQTKRSRPIRCEYCRNKNHVLVDCKCKLTLCLLHLPEDLHNCQFDFKKEHQQFLSSRNPLIKTNQLESI